MTGGAGFVGGWLQAALASAGYPVASTDHPSAFERARKTGSLAPEPARYPLDLRDTAAVERLIAEVRPRAVVHLAALALPRAAAANPEETIRVNYGAVDTLIGALCRHAPRARLLFVSSGVAYAGRPADAAPAREDEPTAPSDAYGASKVAAERRVALAVENEGLDALCVRPFNHTGPGRPADYPESAFARQIARIEAGQQPPVLRVGNLAAIRDFMDVRDVVRAYLVLLERGGRGAVYNVCSGQRLTLRELLDRLLARSPARLQVEVDPSLFEAMPARVRARVGDPSRLRSLGFSPEYTLEETLDSLLADWRRRVSES